MSHHCVIRGHCGARCDVESVDGSHHGRGGDVVDADASTPSCQGRGSREDIAVDGLGRQSNPWKRPGSRIRCRQKTGTFLRPVNRLTAVRIVAAAVQGTSSTDEIDWSPGRARTYCVQTIFCGIIVFLRDCVLNVWKVIFLRFILAHLV